MRFKITQKKKKNLLSLYTRKAELLKAILKNFPCRKSNELTTHEFKCVAY
jgi:hypothetical protein